MLTRIIVSALALSMAMPAFADQEQLAKLIDVEPGEYTLNEMVQLSGTSGRERKQRIEVIMQNREIARQVVLDALNSTPGVTVTRKAR